MKPFAKILVPHDFSEHADRALALAADVARHYEAQVTLLHVLEPPVPPPAAGVFLSGPMRPLPELFELAGKGLEGAALKVRAGGALQVDSKVMEGVPFEAIVRYAADGAFDLIVMGTQGRTGVARALIGSVAERVVRLAKCPVLTVHNAPIDAS